MKKLILIILILLTSTFSYAVTFDWNAVENADGYIMYYYKTDVPGEVWNSAPIPQPPYTLDSRRLERGKEYTFYVTAYNGEGESEPSDTLPFTRPELPFQPPNGNEPIIITTPGKVTITIEVEQ